MALQGLLGCEFELACSASMKLLSLIYGAICSQRLFFCFDSHSWLERVGQRERDNSDPRSVEKFYAVDEGACPRSVNHNATGYNIFLP